MQKKYKFIRNKSVYKLFSLSNRQLEKLSKPLIDPNTANLDNETSIKRGQFFVDTILDAGTIANHCFNESM